MNTLFPALAKTGRVLRSPKTRFQVTSNPMEIVPFCLIPVLPGETMQNLRLETNAISTPVKNRLIGWKKETHFFYIKISDLLVEAYRNMFIDPTNTEVSANVLSSNNGAYYSAKGAIPYLILGYQKIVEHWFRDEGEAWNIAANRYAIAQIKDIGWMDNLIDKDDMPMGADIDDATTMGDLERLMELYQQLRNMQFTAMTFEDWLRSNGISVPDKDENKPERVASFGEWTYPINAIDPTDGSAASAMRWTFKNHQRDPKKFREPGFLIGVTVHRPKFYHSGLAGSAAEFMKAASDWMPNYLRDTPERSLKHFVGDTGPLGDRTTAPDGYWFDMNDILIHGDQYQNIVDFGAAPAVNGAYNMLPLPTGDTFNARYPSAADMQKLFVGDAGNITEDGYVQTSISGFQRDTTVTTVAEA